MQCESMHVCEGKCVQSVTLRVCMLGGMCAFV